MAQALPAVHGQEARVGGRERLAACAGVGRMRCRVGPRGVCTAGLALATPCCSVASVVCAIVLRIYLGRLQTNMVGDPEKETLDECMRDFEGLPVSNQQYIDNHRRCIEELAALDHLHRLPRVRLTVDERICGQADLCTGGDPGRCGDKGAYGSIDYEAGDVTKCYDLISAFKAELTQRRRVALLDQVEQQCTRSDRWDGYAHEVRLRYCMWKHLQFGACINELRANCPEDTSCCPATQNHLGADSRSRRPNVYTCRKSPTVGLYCQHVNDRAPGNATGDGRGEPCSSVTCPSFDWCLDLVDVPGLCLGSVCQDYQRSLNYSVILIILACISLALDIAELVNLGVLHPAPELKTACNAFAAVFKLLGLVLCVAGGIGELVDAAIEKACFNEEGNHSATVARSGSTAFLFAICLAAVGSTCLAPLSARVGGHLTGPSYAKVQPVDA
uniref:Uncharacterized protein n=1 Tax=Alexandrium monilatum TaxID=311494 RepID=A0A7S4QT92_9DINO